MPWLTPALALACKGVDPAPAELDALLHYVWDRYDEGTDEQLAEAIVNLDAAVGGGGLVEAFDGSLSRLDPEQVAAVGVSDRDPAAAPGVFLVNTFDCGFDTLEALLSYPAQEELHGGIYSAYSRRFDTPRADWLGAPGGTLTYRVDYTAKLLGVEYSASTLGALRRVPGGEALVPWGRAVVQRVVLPTPADFGGSSGKRMDQDYQLEIYWERGGDRVLHAYGMWRQAEYGAGISMEDEGSQRLLLNGLLDWDDETAESCATGFSL